MNMKIGARAWGKFLLLLVANMMILKSRYTSAVIHSRNETDRLALLNFKDQISEDPHGVLNSWNDSLQHCKWPGITCNARHQRVTALFLRGMSLFGSISPHLGNLSFIKSIQLGGNRFYGEIPREISRLFRLRNLNLTRNTLSGEIPGNISQCSELRNISFSRNNLRGKIPMELSSLSNLEYLILGVNNFTGQIPPSLGNLSSLRILSLPVNNFEGSVPNELGSLIRLSSLELALNKLTGEFPSSLYNISTLTTVSLAQNFLLGKLPMDIGLKMLNLKALGISLNQFSGKIPISITNSTKLEILDLADNNFEGQVPTNLGNLFNLKWLNLGDNALGQNSPEDLNFIASLKNCSNLQKFAFHRNDFGGQLPNSIRNLSFQLNQLSVEENKLSGTIPEGLGRYINLYSLEMQDNLFSGSIPSDFGKFLNLQGLNLAGNSLSGQLPSTLCNLTSLNILLLFGNCFEGILSSCFGNSRNLQRLDVSRNKLTGIISPNLFTMSFSPIYMDISYNSFNGSLPLEVGNLAGVVVFNCSYNHFSGEIPETVGGFSSLEYLNMQGNFFKGTIPTKLASLKGIQHLDLSENNLTGKIPNELWRLAVLKYLNLSFNDLEGEIPTDGVFGNASLVSLDGNNKLCGGIPELQLAPCIVHHQKKKRKQLLIIIVPVLCAMIFLICVALFSYFRRNGRKKLSSTEPSRPDKMLKISYQDLHRATAGFSSDNLIGSGNFGFVYKGRLDQHEDKLVAVKVIDLTKNGASKSFKAECKALRNIRHRNLVPILTYCSSIDFKGQEFKALVYELMENSSLDVWLHPQAVQTTSSRNLNILQRLNIAVDVASALDYLNNYCEVVIVHCDLKPSNILLDNDLTAHVGDFGLARLLSKTTNASTEPATNSSTFAVKGTVGYAAPEYGMGGEASTEGDIYSFGILLLEMFTGRRPTDDIFVEGLDLHNYVKMNLTEDFLKITSPSLFSREGEENLSAGKENIIVQKCLISIFEIGLKCSATSPNDRMPMKEVPRQLQLIRDAFLGARMNSAAHHI